MLSTWNTLFIKEITKKKFAKIIEAGLEKNGLSCGLTCISGMVQDASHRHDRVNLAMKELQVNYWKSSENAQIIMQLN